MTGEAEKIIARKIDKILGRNGFGSDYTQAELDGWGSEIAAALRDAGMLYETEWEYGVGYSSTLDGWWAAEEHLPSLQSAVEIADSCDDPEIRVLRRRAVGTWSPIPEGE